MTARFVGVTAPPRPLVESTARPEPFTWPVPRLLVPRSHSAVGLSSALWSSQAKRRRMLFQTSELRLSSSSVFLQSVSRSHLVGPAAETARQPLSWALLPFSTSRARGSTSRGFASPATFRLQGLVTLLTVYSPRARAGLISCRQRSWDFALRSVPLPEGTPSVSARDDPPAVSLAAVPSDESSGRNDNARLLGFHPSGSPLPAPVRLTPPHAGCSPGLFSLPGHTTKCLVHAPAWTPLTRLTTLE
jgi:hypothetical protein